MADFCENGNEPLPSVQPGAFLTRKQLSTFQERLLQGAIQRIQYKIGLVSLIYGFIVHSSHKLHKINTQWVVASVRPSAAFIFGTQNRKERIYKNVAVSNGNRHVHLL
jgi:hypothetical protein